MSRALTPAMAAEIVKKTVAPVVLYKGEFDGGTIYLWSGIGPMTWGGNTYTGAGQVLSLSQIEETIEVRAVGVQLGLSGLPAAVVSLALSSARQGKRGWIYLGFVREDKYLWLPNVAGNFASTPDSTALRITGDIDIRARVAASDYTPAAHLAICAKESNRYMLRISQTTGALILTWFDGTSQISASSTANLANADGTEAIVKATLDVNNGAGGYTAMFYTSSDGGFTWAPLGSPVIGGSPTSIGGHGANPLRVGTFDGSSLNFDGKIYWVEIRNGIDGTLVAKFDPTNDWITSALSLTSGSTGEVYTISQSGLPAAEIRVDPPTLIVDPYQIFSGLLDVPVMEETGDAANVGLSYENRLVGLLTANDRRYTPEDQHVEFPGDTGFDYVAGLQDATIVW